MVLVTVQAEHAFFLLAWSLKDGLAARQVARNVTGIDLIIGGHSHSFLYSNSSATPLPVLNKGSNLTDAVNYMVRRYGIELDFLCTAALLHQLEAELQLYAAYVTSRPCSSPPALNSTGSFRLCCIVPSAAVSVCCVCRCGGTGPCSMCGNC